MKIAEYRKELISVFREHQFESPELEASFILEEVLHLRPFEMQLRLKEELTAEQISRIESFKERRLHKEPFQYIFGWTPFRELNLKVGPGCLIPRPETEFMLDTVVKKLPFRAKVCELGTGSGAIALSLAGERKDIEIWGSEISPDAFYWTELNARECDFANAHFFQGDLYSPFPSDLLFDAIVANLPYIAEEERPALPENVREYEPDTALFAPDHGFALIERAISEAPAHLNPKYAQLFFEIGETQGERAVQCALKTGFFDIAEIRNDQYDVPRWLYASHTASLKKVPE